MTVSAKVDAELASGGERGETHSGGREGGPQLAEC